MPVFGDFLRSFLTRTPGPGTTCLKPQEDLRKTLKRRKDRDSLLETLESIVIAFVLAFIFRAFIVEAFVIPTGSMAPTLYGEHTEWRCSDCGYKYAVGVDAGGAGTESLCPNCFKGQHPSELLVKYSGDRILVLKYLFDFEEPQRWDVIVFHNPNEPSQNYIKRLVGLPGETIELRDGNVTVSGRIAPKTDMAQNALWMLVHDTRYKATRQGWIPRWSPDPLWANRDSGFVLERAPEKDKIAWLAYRHRGASGQPENIMDSYAYNSGGGQHHSGSAVVTDLCLRTEATAGQASSVIVVDMRAYKDRFRFELTADGSDQPTRILVNDKLVARAPGGVLPVGRPVEIEAANVDHKLVLLVDGKRVAAQALVETTPQGDPAYKPTSLSEPERDRFDNPQGEEPRHMAAEVRIGARGGPATLAYLKIDRDVYYLNETMFRARGEGTAPGHATQGNPFHMGEGQYFVCGDNSPKSFDSRLWDLPEPTVPRRNLVGKAFFVYWPSAGPRLGIPLPVIPDACGWHFVH
jgi:signal peptidase I